MKRGDVVIVVKCNNLFTVRQQDVQRIIGSLSAQTLAAVDDALRAALNL